MKNKKIILVSLISLSVLVGCQNQTTPTSSNAEVKTELSVDSAIKEQTEKAARLARELELQEKQEAQKKAEEDKKAEEGSEIKQLIDLGGLIGKKQADVESVLGKPEETTYLEKTKILLADYFKLTVLEQITKIEVVYDDEKGAVNFVSMTCIQADDEEAFIKYMTDELTTRYGESSIEKIIDKKGTRKRYWYDENLTYALSYFENNIYFDIFETDK